MDEAFSPRPPDPAGDAQITSDEPTLEESGDGSLRLQDGSLALEFLKFDNLWVEEYLVSLRLNVFAYLGGWREKLNKIEVSSKCAQVARDLEQCLRKHVNRKGEVQVDWYQPRYAVVAKHKDFTFVRFLCYGEALQWWREVLCRLECEWSLIVCTRSCGQWRRVLLCEASVVVVLVPDLTWAAHPDDNCFFNLG